VSLPSTIDSKVVFCKAMFSSKKNSIFPITSNFCCFKAHGQIYHRLDQLVPGEREPRHMQLYFYDTDETIAHRVKRLPKLDTSMIWLILRILLNYPFVLLFKNLDSMSNIAEYNIELNTSISID